MSTLILRNATLIDCTGADPIDNASLVIEDQRIHEIHTGGLGALPAEAEVLDLRGMTLMPGLTDAHVHIGAVAVNILDQHRDFPASFLAVRMGQILEEILQQGYTTVRDAGGADYGFKVAVEQGYLTGPRLLVANDFISQTGGHADLRRRTEDAPICCGSGWRAAICDGADEVRKAARENLRREADHLKVMAGGGAMSPADEIGSSQFTVPEIRAAVEEAAAAGKYVMAHAYSSRSIRNCLEAGVRSIEHGNLMDRETAALIRDHDAFLVPTLVTYEMLWQEGAKYGVAPDSIRKIGQARERGLDAVRLAREAGANIGSGSDLLGPLQVHKAKERELKAQVMTPLEAIASATKVNAELFRLDHAIGTVEPGKLADLIVVDGDPLKDITIFQRYQQSIRLIVKSGAIVKNTLAE